MLRLDLTPGTRWIDLAPGVRVEVQRMGTALISRAQDDLRAARTPDSVTPIGRSAFAMAVARHAIVGWQGVGDEAGKPVPVNAETIAALMDVFPIYAAFEAAYVQPGLMLADEGNVSAPLLNGTTAGVRTTARRAKASAPTAPVKPKRL
jgi:hypothetical protein